MQVDLLFECLEFNLSITQGMILIEFGIVGSTGRAESVKTQVQLGKPFLSNNSAQLTGVVMVKQIIYGQEPLMVQHTSG